MLGPYTNYTNKYVSTFGLLPFSFGLLLPMVAVAFLGCLLGLLLQPFKAAACFSLGLLLLLLLLPLPSWQHAQPCTGF
jgi:hypothetical protein